MIVGCPHCHKPLQVTRETVGKTVRCPACGKNLKFPAPSKPARSKGETVWYWMKTGWLREEEQGPIDELEFMSFLSDRTIKPDTLVRSPGYTQNHWLHVKNIDLTPLLQRERARIASELARQEQELAKQKAKDAAQDKLRRSVVAALSDGVLTADEKIQLYQLAQDMGFQQDFVNELIGHEAQRILNELLHNYLEDGELSPEEEESLQRAASNLDVSLEFGPETQRILDQARMRWAITSGPIEAFPECPSPLNLTKGEKCYAAVDVTWHELRKETQRTTHSGVSGRVKIMTGLYLRLGSSSSRRETKDVLKPIDMGTVFLTNKRLVFLGEKGSKTIRFSAVAMIEAYQDGVQIIKTQGRHPLLEFDAPSEATNVFLLLMQKLVG